MPLKYDVIGESYTAGSQRVAMQITSRSGLRGACQAAIYKMTNDIRGESEMQMPWV